MYQSKDLNYGRGRERDDVDKLDCNDAGMNGWQIIKEVFHLAIEPNRGMGIMASKICNMLSGDTLKTADILMDHENV